MERHPDHRCGHRHLGERLQRLHLREEQGETTSVDTPAEHVAARGCRQLGSLTLNLLVARVVRVLLMPARTTRTLRITQAGLNYYGIDL